jgi:hypothetical protein
MTTLNLIPVNKTVKLSHSIKTDGIIIFRSSQLNRSRSDHKAHAGLDLVADNKDVLLHIGFRPDEDVIIFNARTSSGQWLREARIPFQNRLRGKNHTVTVYDHGDNFQILFNGKTGYTFRKQLPGHVSSLRCDVGKNQVPLFSDPVVAETYHNFAALLVGID